MNQFQKTNTAKIEDINLEIFATFPNGEKFKLDEDFENRSELVDRLFRIVQAPMINLFDWIPLSSKSTMDAPKMGRTTCLEDGSAYLAERGLAI